MRSASRMSCSPSTIRTRATNALSNSSARHRCIPTTLPGSRIETLTSCCGWLARHLFLEGRDGSVDVSLGGVECAHPADIAGRLVPEVEPEALLQSLGDVVRKPGENGVGLHRIKDPHAVDRARSLGEPLRHGV